MANPQLVAECCAAMAEVTNIAITVKCRLGASLRAPHSAPGRHLASLSIIMEHHEQWVISRREGVTTTCDLHSSIRTTAEGERCSIIAVKVLRTHVHCFSIKAYIEEPEGHNLQTIFKQFQFRR